MTNIIFRSKSTVEHLLIQLCFIGRRKEKRHSAQSAECRYVRPCGRGGRALSTKRNGRTVATSNHVGSTVTTQLDQTGLVARQCGINCCQPILLFGRQSLAVCVTLLDTNLVIESEELLTVFDIKLSHVEKCVDLFERFR